MENEIAIVTGAGRGIGADIAMTLASAGCRVIVNYRESEEQANALVAKINQSGGTALAVRADVTQFEDVQSLLSQTVEQFGAPTILVNNVGPGIVSKKIVKTDWDDFQSCFEAGVKSAFNCSKSVGALMMKNRRGSIVNIATQFTFGLPPIAMATYVTAKYALVGFSKCLAGELAPFGVNVNMVSPGLTETDMVSHMPESFKQSFAEGTPLKRNTECSDISNAVLFLLSNPSRFVTGVNLPVCGGNIM